MLRNDAHRFPPGSVGNENVLHHYTLLRKFGEGGFGACFLAKDVRNSDTVVVKQIKLTGLNAKEAQCEEARVLKKLQHSNIIQFRDAQVSG
jgi:serine/threonine protein kinase